MSRCVFGKGDQRRFLQEVMQQLHMNTRMVASLVGLSSRTICDWKREKYFSSLEIMTQLSSVSNVPLPHIIQRLDEHWSARKFAHYGGVARQKLYGSTFSDEDRRNGGKHSWINRRIDPEHSKSVGLVCPNVFQYPSIHNPSFAEFIGIVLGDGGITPSQLTITLNRVADKEYIQYVLNLISVLFGYKSFIHERQHACATTITINGVDFIDFLLKRGLNVGNKVKQQVGVPSWISKNLTLATYCVRGLMDTDGCVFNNNYKVHGKWYQYKKIAFSNRSIPLLMFVCNTLKSLGLSPIYYQGIQIRLCKHEEVEKYMISVGSSNPRLLKFFS
jgi:DNA-binding XRE family transcriptional regulator